jgi:hypothetical protein
VGCIFCKFVAYIYTMKNAILISILFLSAFKLSLGACRSTHTLDHSGSIDTSRYAILKLKFNDIPTYVFKDCKPADLSNEDIVKIEVLVLDEIARYNKEAKKVLISHPEKYYKQLIAVSNSNGEKEVWVNCFCYLGNYSYWKNSIVVVLDGGSCFFQLKINLTKNSVYDFGVNGVG